MNTRPARPAWLVPAAVAVVLTLVVALGFGGGLLAGGGAPSPAGTAIAAGPSVSSSAAPSGDVTAPTPSAAASAPPATPAPSPSAEAPITTAEVAIVPVTSFRSTRTAVRPADVRAIANGSGPLDALVLVEADADAILASLGHDRAAFGVRLVTVTDAAALAIHLARHRTRIGFLRADDVDASVRALAWGGKALFGVDRVAGLAAWPLRASLTVAVDAVPAYDPARAWTLVAGGDILLDRGVSLAVGAARRGADFMFDGGTVDITGRCKDCSPFGWDTPYTKRTGNAGVVRDLVKGADIAIANFENPAPNRFRFHASDTVFSANPAHLAALAKAGIDWVSLANNHIGDAGRTGILQTMANLDDHGILHSGAGRNAAKAHQAALIDVEGVTVGLLGYDTIARRYHAGPDTIGSANMTKAALRRDIAAARKAGADVVIVFPHWGVEYTTRVTPKQERLGRAAIDAGADMVIGNHPHWVGAMEIYRGKPIWYALGNLVFDQTWSIPTMEGITLELTMSGTELVQVRIRPHLILGKAQPNFMDPAGSGREVMSQLFRASDGRLPW
jgi:poly-gamma-glutamate synthesis protein (capsule biosynthesis protein)